MENCGVFDTTNMTDLDELERLCRAPASLESAFALIFALDDTLTDLAAELRALRELEKIVSAVADCTSMYDDETDDPRCCDPYVVDRVLFRSMRSALQSVERAGRRGSR